MKNPFVLIILLFVPLFSFGQQQTTPQASEKIIVDTKDLPPDFVNQLKQKQQIEHYGEWAGKGKEVGIAIRDGLVAVKDVSIEFSNSKLGTFTMVLVAWKVIGKDLLRFGVGLLFAILSTFFIFRSYFKTCVNRNVIKEDPGLFKYPKKYELIDAQYGDGGGATIHGLFWVAFLGISALIMFT